MFFIECQQDITLKLSFVFFSLEAKFEVQAKQAAGNAITYTYDIIITSLPVEEPSSVETSSVKTDVILLQPLQNLEVSLVNKGVAAI